MNLRRKFGVGAALAVVTLAGAVASPAFAATQTATDLTNPTLTRTAQAIELALAERGYATLFATSNNNLDEERKILELVRSRQVDGILPAADVGSGR